uniref:Uncharacterized protein n=1 Tax=Panagrolaimus sp. PS1159 TaxID=55785 RepID=A0AC35G4X9_9BILA
MADQKNERYQCCCGHITTIAKFVAIIGIVSSGFSFITAIFYWYYLPFSIALLIVYILVFTGISKHRPSFLLPAKIIL